MNLIKAVLKAENVEVYGPGSAFRRCKKNKKNHLMHKLDVQVYFRSKKKRIWEMF